MTPDKLQDLIIKECRELTQLFQEKNKDYGDGQDAFYNFRQSALRLYGSGDKEDMFKVLVTLADKHWVTLSSKGMKDKHFTERLRDIAVYALIGIAMQGDKSA